MKPLFLSALLSTGLLASPALAACYETPIEDFFPAFAASTALQQEVVAERIMWAALDPEAGLENEMSVVPRTAEMMEYPVVPDLEAFLADGGTVTYTESVSPDGSLKGEVATLAKGEDYLLNVIFTNDPCWTLIGVMNQSR